MKEAWKVLGENRIAHHGGKGAWPEPGEWLRVYGRLKPCENGLHLCAREHLVQWLGPRIWRVEYDDSECIDHGDKLMVRAARLVDRYETWNERTARLFAADCAERVLPIYEAAYPSDARPRQAVEAARAFARGEISTAASADAWAAASDAAWAAAWDAAWEAAWEAASAAASAAARDAAREAARDAAWAAAREAASAAASADARDAARAWQTDRLFDYLEGRAS